MTTRQEGLEQDGLCGIALARRLAIFTTHPIQYQVPWFRALAAASGIELEVVFSRVPDASEQGIGFGTAFSWDIPMRDGYSSRVLEDWHLPSLVPRWARRPSQGISAVLHDIRPDIVLILGWQELSLVQAALACRRRGVPVILRGESNALHARSCLVSAIHAGYFQLFDAFLAIGEANAGLYRSAGVLHDRIFMAKYFVDNARFSSEHNNLLPEREAIRSGWGIPSSARCFVFVGKLEPKKHVLDFLDGVGRARDAGSNVHALVVGSGEQMNAARAFVAERRIPASFAGFLNQSQICRAYVAADALVLPSDFGETWGLVVNEAMAVGLPAVVSDRCGCAGDLVLDGLTGRVFPFGDVGRLSEAIGELATGDKVRAAMGNAAFARVRSGYSIEHAVAATLEVVEACSRGRSRGQN